MKAFRASMVLSMATIECATPAFGADGPEQPGGSPMVWVLLFLPTLVFAAMVYSVLRNTRRNKETVDRNIQRLEEHRRFSEDHMKRLDSQVELLNHRLGQVVELLTAIEQGQRRDRG